ncbi:Rossmann-like domain-containing protein [Candidatus Riflebacteria bacterium]
MKKVSVIDDLLKNIPGTDERAKVLYMGLYYTGVKFRKLGLAFTYRSCFKVPHLCPPVRKAGSLLKLQALEMANYLKSENTLEASIGLAAVNSLLEIPEDLAYGNAIPLLMDICRGRDVAMVGYFPFAEKIREIAKTFFVTEKNRDADEGSVSKAEIKDFIKRAEIRIITGTTVINHSFDHIMSLCRNGFNILFGPSVPPTSILFKHNVDLLVPVTIENEKKVIRAICEPALVPQMEGLKTACMAKDKDILKRLPPGNFISFLKNRYPKFNV